MADKKIYIDDSPKNPKLKTSPFDHTFATNITGTFGKVQVPFLKYYPPHSRVEIRPSFAFDLQPLLYPAQTNVRCHFKLYQVPLRILWEDFEDYFSLIGSDGTPTNAGSQQFVVPYVKRPTGWNGKGSLAEQIGISNIKYSSVPDVVIRPAKLYVGFHEHGSEFINTHYIPATSNSNSLSLGFNMMYNEFFTDDGRISDKFHIQFSVISTSSASLGSLGQLVLRSGRYVRTSRQNGYDIDNTGDGWIIEDPSDESQVHINLPFDSSSSSPLPNFYTELSSSTIRLDGQPFYRHNFGIYISNENFYLNLLRFMREGFSLHFFIDFPVDAYSIIKGNIFDYANDLSVSVDRMSVPQTVTSKDNGDLSIVSSTTLTLTGNFGVERAVRLSIHRAVNEINTLRDSVDGAEPKDPVCALPLRAIEFVHNYFMRNPRIDPFIKDGKPTYNRFLTNTSSGADSTTPVDTWLALYEDDYFTTCVKEPQMGNAPLVGVTVNDLGNTGILTFSDESSTVPNNYTVHLEIGQDGRVLPLSVYGDVADRPNVHRLSELISAGISINDLRNVSTFQRMLERMQRTGYKFENVVYEFFGTKPPIGDRYPRYLGGITRNITVDKITQMAETDALKLGQFRGTARFRYPENNKRPVKITTYTTEPCYIVGILYFTVTPCYPQYTPKHFYYKDPLDWFMNPEFATIGPQPVYAKELAFGQLNENNLNDVFGYNRPYAELFANLDEVHGDYLGNMSNYLLQRWFARKPELNKSFISINPLDLTNIFAVTDSSDKIFGQMLFQCSVTLPAPRSYLPRSI